MEDKLEVKLQVDSIKKCFYINFAYMKMINFEILVH